MGCDIHIHAEIKVNGKWLHYDQPECRRDYALFEKMAGVRGDVENAISAPRGLPADATETTVLCSDFYDSDGHTHSWLSSKELADLANWCNGRGRDYAFPEWDCYLFGNCYSDFHKHPSDRKEGVEDIRFIFWFDN